MAIHIQNHTGGSVLCRCAEVEAVTAAGGRIATLSPRILRCETAPLAALAVLMERSGNMR